MSVYVFLKAKFTQVLFDTLQVTMARHQNRGNGDAHQTANRYDHNGQVVVATAHDWEEEKNKYKDFYDDGTMTFFW